MVHTLLSCRALYAVMLNVCVSLESLRKYFTQFGKVEACTIMRDAAGRSRCFAFLTFEDPASVNAVMVREHFLDLLLQGVEIGPANAVRHGRREMWINKRRDTYETAFDWAQAGWASMRSPM